MAVLNILGPDPQKKEAHKKICDPSKLVEIISKYT